MSTGEPPPNILLIRRRYLGDIVLLGSVLRNARAHWPAAKLTLLTQSPYRDVLALQPDLTATLVLPRRAAEWPGFLLRLRRSRYTHVLDFDNTEKTAVLTLLTGAPERATFNREKSRFRYRFCYSRQAVLSDVFYHTNHITETYLALASAIGIPITSREVRLTPRPEDLAAARRVIPPGGKKVLVHPGSRLPNRLWPTERFAAVCDRLQDELGAQVFLTCGPGEEARMNEIRRQAQTHLVVLPPAPSVAELAALAAQFNVFLCHDSGPMHVAAAVGTPVVALLGSQNSTVWGPLGKHHTVLQTPLPCACIGAAAPTVCDPVDSYRNYCVRMLGIEQVFQAVAVRISQPRA
jgi:ADP-heptose:LPS heptosyltransferase